MIPRDPRSFPQKDQPLVETTTVATQNLLLHRPESAAFTTRNEFINGELPSLESICSYLYGLNLQSTDSLALTLDFQVW